MISLQPSRIRQVAIVLRSLGLKQAHVGHVLWREPNLLHTAESALARKVRFLLEELRGSADDVAAHPAYFQASLQQRVGPRLAAVRAWRRHRALWLG